MTAVTPAAGGSWKLLAASPSCVRAGCAVRPACSSCRPPSRVRQRSADRQRGRHQRIVCGFLQHPTGQGGRRVQGGRIETTICDQAPRPQRSPDEPLRAWAVADRAVGRRVAPCESPLRDAGDPPRCIPRRRAQVDRWDRDAFLSRLRRAIPDSWNRRLNGKSLQRRLGRPPPVGLGRYLPHSSEGGEAALHARWRSHDGRSASGGHL